MHMPATAGNNQEEDNMQVYQSRTTKKLHKGDGVNTACNYSGQARRPQVLAVSAAFLAKAPAEMYCSKCFPTAKA